MAAVGCVETGIRPAIEPSISEDMYLGKKDGVSAALWLEAQRCYSGRTHEVGLLTMLDMDESIWKSDPLDCGWGQPPPPPPPTEAELERPAF